MNALANTARALLEMFPEASHCDVDAEATVFRDGTEEVVISAYLTRPNIGPVCITAKDVEQLLAKALAISLRESHEPVGSRISLN